MKLFHKLPAQAAFVHVENDGWNLVYIEGDGLAIDEEKNNRHKKGHGKAEGVTPNLD